LPKGEQNMTIIFIVAVLTVLGLMLVTINDD
jgi:hypothetical protein